MPAAFSSLRDLFVGDDDCAPVYKPGLVALVCDALTPEPTNLLTVAEKLYPALEDVGPRVWTRYVDEIGEEPMVAIRDGFNLWRNRANIRKKTT